MTAKAKRVAEAMAADKIWDKARGVKPGSARDKKIDARVRAKATKGGY